MQNRQKSVIFAQKSSKIDKIGKKNLKKLLIMYFYSSKIFSNTLELLYEEITRLKGKIKSVQLNVQISPEKKRMLE